MDASCLLQVQLSCGALLFLRLRLHTGGLFGNGIQLYSDAVSQTAADGAVV